MQEKFKSDFWLISFDKIQDNDTREYFDSLLRQLHEALWTAYRDSAKWMEYLERISVLLPIAKGELMIVTAARW